MPHGAQPIFLAQELVDAIMDEVGDKQSLAACSLVSRSWMHGSSRHLFRTLVSRKHHPQLEVLVPTELEEVDALLVFLATCERARKSVQRLTLKSISFPWGSGLATHTAETLLWNLSRLPRLKSLVLDRISLGDGVESLFNSGPPPLHPTLQPLHRLHHSAFNLRLDFLSMVCIDGFGQRSSHLARFLGGFWSIKELRFDPGLSATVASGSASPVSILRAKPLRVQRIVVSADSILQFLSVSLDPRFLTHIVLRLNGERFFRYAQAFLEKFTRIRYAIVDISWIDQATVPTNLINLAKLSNLELLTICTHSNDASVHFRFADPRRVTQLRRRRQLWNAIVGMLASAAPSLRYVIFHKLPAVHVARRCRDPTGYLGQEEWDKFNAVLSSFPRLERVEMLIETSPRKPSDAERSDQPQIDAIRAKISENVRERFHLAVTHPRQKQGILTS